MASGLLLRGPNPGVTASRPVRRAGKRETLYCHLYSSRPCRQPRNRVVRDVVASRDGLHRLRYRTRQALVWAASVSNRIGRLIPMGVPPALPGSGPRLHAFALTRPLAPHFVWSDKYRPSIEQRSTERAFFGRGDAPPHVAVQHLLLSRRILRLAIQLIESLRSASVAETSELFGVTGLGAGAAPPDHPAITDRTGSAPPSLMELPSLAADNLGDLHQNLGHLVKGVIETNLRTSQEMLRVTNHDEFVALQQRFVRDYMAALMQGSLQLFAAIQRRTGAKC
jgi:hypothetical protein